MLKHLFVLMSCMALNVFSFAQDENEGNPFNTDRPGQSINPNTVGKKYLQFQGGYGYGELNSPSEKETRDNFNLTAKFGLTERVEVSSSVSAASVKEYSYALVDPLSGRYTKENPEIDEYGGVSQFRLATRGNILKGKGLRPSMAVQVEYSRSNTPGKKLLDEQLSAAISMSSELMKGLSLTANFVFFVRDEYFFTANVAYVIQEKVGVFVEYYPQFLYKNSSDDILRHRESFLNTGSFWQVGPNFQIDGTFGFRVIADDIFAPQEEEIFYLEFGFTKRFQL